MVFKEYKFGAWKKEIRELLRKRLALKNKVRYHESKITHFKSDELPKIEKELQMYLDRAEQ